MNSKHIKDSHQDGHRDGLFAEFAATTYDEWRTEAERLLKGAPFDKRMLTRTPEGITLQPIYTSKDTEKIAHLGALPGFAPYVRGSHPVSVGDDAWQVCQEIDYATSDQFNRALRRDIDGGLQAVVLPLDNASRDGLDSDEAQAGEVGVGGVSITSLNDLAATLDGVSLRDFPVTITAGSGGLPSLAFYAALAKRSGVEPKQLRGAVASDPLGEAVSTGKLPASPERLCAEMAEMTAWASDHAPRLGTVWIHGEPYHDGGASAVQELAFVIATGLEYLRRLESATLPLERITPHLRFSFGLGSHVFMEIAKLRAARLLWHRVTEVCGLPEDKRSMLLHARSSRYNKTIYDPYVNMLRATTEAFSGVVGGADSLAVAPFDEPVRQADDFSRRIARNVQIVLGEEAHLSQVVDPSGGSWYVERVTADIAEAAWELFRDIEKKGGMSQALADGFPQTEIARIADGRRDRLAERKSVAVGINRYPNPGEKRLEPRPINTVQLHKRRSEEVRNSRPTNVKALKNLTGLPASAPGTVVDTFIEAAEQGATVGMLTRAVRPQGDTPYAIPAIPARRAAEPFERLREAVETRRAGSGGMRVYLATLGSAGAYMSRLDFAASFFEVGGFEVVRTTGHDTPREAADNALAAEADIVVICGLDATYADQAPVVAEAIKAARPKTKVVLAGLPPDEKVKEKLKRAGVDDFIHIKSNVLQTLTAYAAEMGVPS